MKTAILMHAPRDDGPEPLARETRRNEVLVRTVAAGLYHSDLHFIEGAYPMPMPAVRGHEAAGIVDAVGANVNYLKPGDHIINCMSVFYGHCEFWLAG